MKNVRVLSVNNETDRDDDIHINGMEMNIAHTTMTTIK